MADDQPESMSHADAAPQDEAVLSVSELTSQIKFLLDQAFGSVWVSGEMSDLARPRSGHCYFTLKDESAQIAAVMWRGVASRLRFDLHDGLEVVCRGHLDVYAPRGKYQLIVDEIEPRGIGSLELALRQLHEKLSREGLFDPARKRPIPRFSRRIAVVTSPTGAAIRDFLEVLRRRWRGVDVLVVPTRVQGDGAAQEIAAAIQLVNRLAKPVDCLVVTRGGGSLEDLWAFNEEVVVRAIHASRVPVISGVGHEIDVTLCDLVADVRALTPSEAAERVAPAAEEIAHLLRQYHGRLTASLRARAARARRELDTLAGHRVFRRPFERIHDAMRRLDEFESRAGRAVRHRLEQLRHQTQALAGQLDSLSPVGVLARGYSLTQRVSDGRLIRDARDLSPGDELDTRFAQGHVRSRVEKIDPAAS